MLNYIFCPRGVDESFLQSISRRPSILDLDDSVAERVSGCLSLTSWTHDVGTNPCSPFLLTASIKPQSVTPVTVE